MASLTGSGERTFFLLQSLGDAIFVHAIQREKIHSPGGNTSFISYEYHKTNSISKTMLKVTSFAAIAVALMIAIHGPSSVVESKSIHEITIDQKRFVLFNR